MADISKCNGIGCSMKERCYRYTAKSSTFQSYLMGKIEIKNNSCPLFWANYT